MALGRLASRPRPLCPHDSPLPGHPIGRVDRPASSLGPRDRTLTLRRPARAWTEWEWSLRLGGPEMTLRDVQREGLPRRKGRTQVAVVDAGQDAYGCFERAQA